MNGSMQQKTLSGTPPGQLGREFASFAAIGAAAFFIDAGTLHVALFAGAGFYVGRLISWTVAASFTWYLNRRFTFGSAEAQPPLRQWLRFLAANSLGGAVNYATYAALVATSPTARSWPVLAVGAGSAAGLALNFFLSRYLVFRSGRG